MTIDNTMNVAELQIELIRMVASGLDPQTPVVAIHSSDLDGHGDAKLLRRIGVSESRLGVRRLEIVYAGSNP